MTISPDVRINIENMTAAQDYSEQRMITDESNGRIEDRASAASKINVFIQMEDKLRYGGEYDSMSDMGDEYDRSQDTADHYDWGVDVNPSTRVGEEPSMKYIEAKATKVRNSVKTWWWRVSGKQHELQTKNALRRTFSKRYMGPDAINLFWFRRPRLLMKAFQYTYFETSLLFAVLLFNWWQDLDFIVQDKTGGDWSFRASAIAGVFLMLFSALFVLPVYALTSVVGSHCPEQILRKARKKNLQPNMVSALERMSKDPLSLLSTSDLDTKPFPKHVSLSVDDSSHANNGGAPGVELEMVSKGIHEDWVQVHKDQTPLNTLIGAMMEKKIDQLKDHDPQSALALSRLSMPTTKVSEQKSATTTSAAKKPSLARISMPIMQLRESAPPAETDTEPDAQQSAQRSLGKRSMSKKSLSRQSLPPSLARASLPMMELHDIEEVSSPKAGSPKRNLTSSSPEVHAAEAQKSQADGQPALGRNSSPGPAHAKPDLARNSMPLMNVAERKHEAATYTLHDIHEEDHHHEDHHNEDHHNAEADEYRPRPLRKTSSMSHLT